jgi:hypothetical protein
MNRSGTHCSMLVLSLAAAVAATWPSPVFSQMGMGAPSQAGSTTNLMLVNPQSLGDQVISNLLSGITDASTGKGKRYGTFWTELGSTVGDAGVLLKVQVYSNDESFTPADAKEALAAAVKRLEQTLTAVYKVNMETIKARLNVAAEHAARSDAMAEDLRNQQQKLHEQLGWDAAPEGATELSATLRRERLQTRIESAGLKARREAIIRAIDELSKKLKAAQEEQQGELQEFEKIVKIREKQLELADLQTKVGGIPNSELNKGNIEVELAHARADLAERRRVVAQKSGSEQLARLNQQLADVQIEMATAEARLTAVEGMLDRLRPSADIERLTRELEVRRAEQVAAAAKVSELKAQLEGLLPPRLVEIRPDAAEKDK